MSVEEHFATKAVKRAELQGPILPVQVPIYATSTYQLVSADQGARLSELDETAKGYLYSRWANPTNDSAAEVITRLESGYATHVTASGMAAISAALFSLLKAGDHVIAPNPVYGGTHEVFHMLQSYGVEVSWASADDVNTYIPLVKKNTKVIYGETPTNPKLWIIDLETLAKLGKQHNAITVVDSTFASPYNQNPIKIGIDVVIHSCTKYLGGHADLTAGCIVSSTKELHKGFFQTLKLFGGTLSPFDAFLLTRGIKTLDVRMERINKNALAVATFLSKHEKVASVFYPLLPSHPQYELAKRQMKGGSGIIAFEVKGGVEAGKKVIEAVKVITLAVSLGGVESLIEHPASMTHTMVSREDRIKGGISDGLIRLSIGIEDERDLITDLNNALKLV
jgi:methionine-gamma-lyase